MPATITVAGLIRRARTDTGASLSQRGRPRTARPTCRASGSSASESLLRSADGPERRVRDPGVENIDFGPLEEGPDVVVGVFPDDRAARRVHELVREGVPPAVATSWRPGPRR
jgi:hypothetical protein